MLGPIELVVLFSLLLAVLMLARKGIAWLRARG